MSTENRFTVTYRVQGAADEIAARADAIRFEQTVEFPMDLTPERIVEASVGRVVEIAPAAAGGHSVVISYPSAIVGKELTQFLNVIFGNTSIQPGVRVERFDLPPEMLVGCRGPRFGRQGLRTLLDAARRPLLCTALKPMGLSARELADQARQFALGGIDIIKDDHGLADQAFSPFGERVRACAKAVAEANARTGFNSIYMPNVTAPHDQVVDRAHLAKAYGAGGILISPGLTGFDAARRLADDDQLALPIMSHPALLGSFTASPDNGISHYALYGQINRLAGIDAVVFPSWGGRFAFTRDECLSIAAGTTDRLGSLAPIFPAPGGGMKRDRVEEMREAYGSDVIFLIGGDLHRPTSDLAANSRRFRDLVESYV